LLVIGPEKLPKLARIAGFWVGKTRHIVASVKEEIKEEHRLVPNKTKTMTKTMTN
jgi:sec-independent protein translocase protein TatB